MRRYLVIANRTLGAQELTEHLRRLAREQPVSFTLLVPVHPVDDDEQQARARLDTAIDRLSLLGIEVDGTVTTEEPADLVPRVASEDVDEVVVATLPRGISRWLATGLPTHLEERLPIPVTHILVPAGLPERARSRAVRLTVYCGERDQHNGKPLHSEIVARARKRGLAGATVLRGVEGYGASSVIHTTRLLTLSEDLPVVIVLIDSPERIEGFLPELNELVTTGLLVTEDVDIIKYAGKVGD